MKRPKQHTKDVAGPGRARASIRRLLSSVALMWHLYLRPRPWSYQSGWAMGKLEPGRHAKPKSTPKRDVQPHEFCDRCHVAEAAWKIILPDGLLIYFCNHHYNQHKWALGAHGFEVKEVKQ